jgi:cysteine desulfuration protein SufE
MLAQPSGSLLAQTRELFMSADPSMKADLLIEYADRYQPVPESVATPPYPAEYKVPACESDVYLFTENIDSKYLRFRYAVQNPHGISAKALAMLLEECLSDRPFDEILAVDESLVYDLFGRSISMGKGQGLISMIALLRSNAQNAQHQFC